MAQTLTDPRQNNTDSASYQHIVETFAAVGNGTPFEAFETWVLACSGPAATYNYQIRRATKQDMSDAVLVDTVTEATVEKAILYDNVGYAWWRIDCAAKGAGDAVATASIRRD